MNQVFEGSRRRIMTKEMNQVLEGSRRMIMTKEMNQVLEGGRRRIMDMNLNSCTAVFAMRCQDSIVVCTEGRKLENLCGSVKVDDAIKFYEVYGNIYVAAGGVSDAVHLVVYLVRRSCNLLHIPEPEYETVENVAEWFKRHADYVLSENAEHRCAFIVFGSVNDFSPVEMYKISLDDGQYEVESSDVLWAGSGGEYVEQYVLDNIDDATNLRNNGKQAEVRDFARKAIYNARLNDFCSDGHIRAVSIFYSRGGWWPVEVMYQTSRLIYPRLYVPVERLDEVYGAWGEGDFEPQRLDYGTDPDDDNVE